MKVVKLALLGTAALAAVSVSARADDLSALKAQIEALNARISTLEATPSVPAGYQLLSIAESDAIIVPSIDDTKDFGINQKATNIGILPTADVPASTNIQWSGNVRAAVRWLSPSFGDDRVDVRTRAGLKVVATTDTAVGEVGVRVALLGVSNGSGALNIGNHTVTTDGYWGWWKITPELTLGGGVDGSLAGNGNGFDGKCSCYFAGGDDVGGYNHAGGDPSQIRLSYASGPVSFAIALEDDEDQDVVGIDALGNPIIANVDSAFGVAGEVKWSGDSMGLELNAGFWAGDDDLPGATDAAWTVNIGGNVALGDIANLSIAAGTGEDSRVNGNSDRYTKASAHLGFTLSDTVTAELGFSHKWVSGPGDFSSIGAGIYYSPVSQLTIGLEAGHRINPGPDASDAAIVTIYKF